MLNKILILLCLFMVGCQAGTSFNSSPRTSRSGEDISWAQPSRGGSPLYSISLGVLGDQQDAQDMAEKAKAAFGAENIWLQKGLLGYSINYGHFDSERRAQQARDDIRDNARQLQLYFLTIVEADTDPPMPDDFHLLNHRFPLTIEVCRFTNEPENRYFNRKADAVAAVRKLRASNYDAYLIHGPVDSRVYVGAFYDEDLVWNQNRFGQPVVSGYGPRIKSTLSQFTFYYFNGLKMKEVTTDKTMTTKLSEAFFRPIVIALDAIEKNGLPQ